MAPHADDVADLFARAKELHKSGKELARVEADYKSIIGSLSSDNMKSVDWEADVLHLLGALMVQRLRPGPMANFEENDESDSSLIGSNTNDTTQSEVGSRISCLADKDSEENQALAYLKRAVHLQPKNSKFWMSLGTAQWRLAEKTHVKLLEGACDAFLRTADLSADLSLTQFKSQALERAQCVMRILETDKLPLRRAVIIQQILELKPEHPRFHYILGICFKEMGKDEDAIQEFEKHIEIADCSHDSDPSGYKVAHARHWSAVLRGETTAAAPQDYVAGLFDCYAEKFEAHLVGQLQYKTPQALNELIRGVITNSDEICAPFERVMDLGCGTGLMGPLVKQLTDVRCLEGMDLSSQMLVKAREKGVYDVLFVADLNDAFLPKSIAKQADSEGLNAALSSANVDLEGIPDTSEAFGLVVASDVFVYIGCLDGIFAKARRWMHQGGLFAFSTEFSDDPIASNLGYKLNPTGRYSHAPEYVRGRASQHNFVLRAQRSLVLRYNGGEPVNGNIWVLSAA